VRERSAYILLCAGTRHAVEDGAPVERECGAMIDQHEPEGTCPKCGAMFRIERGNR
jgi:Zn finger protein HypA/HybF involved in hydrogenase expression